MHACALLVLAATVAAQTTCFVGNANQQICWESGNLVRTVTDGVVNAANAGLMHGGGIALALANAAGPIMQMESNAIIARNGPLKVSQTAVTDAGNLPATVRSFVAFARARADGAVLCRVGVCVFACDARHSSSYTPLAPCIRCSWRRS